jgi:frataxin-like iron-binding protein CyaY
VENIVNVRWLDGYHELFEVIEWRASNGMLWMRLKQGGNRHISLTNVRWFSLRDESHEIKDPSLLYGAQKSAAA